MTSKMLFQEFCLTVKESCHLSRMKVSLILCVILNTSLSNTFEKMLLICYEFSKGPVQKYVYTVNSKISYKIGLNLRFSHNSIIFSHAKGCG